MFECKILFLTQLSIHLTETPFASKLMEVCACAWKQHIADVRTDRRSRQDCLR